MRWFCTSSSDFRDAPLGGSSTWLSYRMRAHEDRGGTCMALAGKVAMVTGGSRGIGRAIALEMAKAGANVAVNCLCEDDDSHETEKLLRATSRRVLICYGDVAAYEKLESNVTAVVETFGRLDIAVANAAYSVREPFSSADLSEFRRTVEVTMWGTFNLFRIAAKQM